MKKFIQFVIACLLSQAIFAQPNSWKRIADFGGGVRTSVTAFTIGNKIYLGLGSNGTSVQKDFWEYEPATDKWTRKADFGGDARSEAVGFSINGKGYIGIGWNSNYSYFKDFWEYDPVTDMWTKKADFGGTARGFSTGFAIGNKGYIGAGYRYDTGTFSDFWEYDPSTDKWTRKADFGGGGRSNPTSFTIGNKGYMGVGWSGGWNRDFWEYDQATDKWTRKADFGGSAREWVASFSIGSKGYIGTGYPPDGLRDFWEYDQAANKWTRKADFGGVGRDQAKGISIGNKGYFGSGWTGSKALSDFWEYTPDGISTGVPTVTSFTPASGPVGTTVTITGTNFGANPADNIVYFGATKATVIAASTTSLTVTVAAGATYLPISVTTNNLTAYSAAPFIVTFNNGGGGFNANSFAAPLEFATNSGGSFGVLPGDLDGDGKADIIVNNLLNGNMSVFGNTSVSGAISFSSAAVYAVIGNGQYPGNKTVDLDGDGKLDLAVANQQVSSISVFRNTSTTGNITLSSKIDFTTGTAPADLAFGDIDGDGKTDMVTADIDVNKFSVLLNTGTPGNISFAAKTDFPASANPRSLAISDVDGDGKPDIVIINIFGTNTISVFRNTSTAGAVSFAAKVDFLSYGDDAYIFAGDLDGDNKPDLVVTDLYSSAISVFRNTCTTGNISFDSYINYTTAPGPYYVSIGDLDGDGKADVAVAHNTGTVMSVLKNNSTTGTISLGAPVIYKVSSASVIPQSLAICDLDNDGKPDIALAGWAGKSLYVLRNLVGPSGCNPPTGLNVTGITKTSALLRWKLPEGCVAAFKIRYRVQGSNEELKRLIKGTDTSVKLYNLLPGTAYEWAIFSVCKTDAKSAWVKGPGFTTSSAFASNDAISSGGNVIGKTSLQITPNPNKGNFTVQMQLPAKAASTTIALYNNFGQLVWQQNLGNISGTVNKTIALENKLSAGLYTLTIQRSDIKLNQKMMINR